MPGPMLWRQQLVDTKQEKMVPGKDHSGTDGGCDRDSASVGAQQQPLRNRCGLGRSMIGTAGQQPSVCSSKLPW